MEPTAMHTRVKTPAQALLVVVSVPLFVWLNQPSDFVPYEDPAHLQTRASTPPAPRGETYHGVEVHHVAPRDGAPLPSWVPVAGAGAGGLLVLGLGVLGARLLLRRPEPDDPFGGDDELRALVEAHERRT